MTMTEQRSAFRIIADDFMAKKGLGDIAPFDSEELEGNADCWYFYYDLPQGVLELEVYYDRARDDWEVAVTSFPT